MRYHSHLLLFFWLIFGAIASNQDLSDTIKCVKEYINSFQSSMDSKVFKIFTKAFPNTL